MLDQLMDFVRESGQQTVVENPAVPNEHNEAVMQEASSSIFSGMQNMLQTQGPGALKSLFEGVQSGDTNRPEVQQVANQFSGNIAEKFGINSNAAKAIAISLIPVVLGKLMHRSQNADSSSGFSIGNILGSLMGGGNNSPQTAGIPQQTSNSGGGGMLSSIGNSLGLDKNGDGQTDLKDLMSMFGR
jgi:hypothetical protein